MPTRVFDRPYVSQYSTPTMGVVIHVDGVAADPDGSVVDITMKDAVGATVFNRTATRVDVGNYAVTLSSSESDTPGEYTLLWEYDVDGDAEFYETYIEVGWTAPDFDALTPEMKGIVDRVWLRFDDLFDAPYGGPHLQSYVQTDWGGRNRVAQLLRAALDRINIVGQPHQGYTLDGANGSAMFPVDTWGGLLTMATYVEVIKHLIRSYVEQPELSGMTVPYENRRDYMQRWQAVLEMEREDLAEALENFKISALSLGAPLVIVGGGMFGNYGYGMRLSHSEIARPHYYWAINY